MRVGFIASTYTVEESAGVVVVEVQVLADEYGNITDAGLPLGVRVTSKDGSAVGKIQWFYIDKYVQALWVKNKQTPPAVLSNAAAS